jgi:hypothetical protein
MTTLQPRASATAVLDFATNGQTHAGPLETEHRMKKLLGGVAIAFALFYLLTQPQSAAEVVKGAGGVVGDAFNAAITFITALFK